MYGHVITVDRSGTDEALYTTEGRRRLCESKLRGKRAIAEDLDRRVHEFMLGQDGPEVLPIPMNDFPLRWASGGVLSIVEWRGDFWVPFFFRDIEPVGWNISLGGSEDEHELNDPIPFLFREFMEETLVLRNAPRKPGHRTTKGFQIGPLPPKPPHALKKFAADHIDLRGYYDGLPLNPWDATRPGDWTDVRDARTHVSLRIEHEGRDLGTFRNLLVCFNLLELGIEVVKVVEYELDPDDYILDGEIFTPRSELVRMPVAMISHDYLREVFDSADGAIELERVCTEESKDGVEWTTHEPAQPSVRAGRPPRPEEIRVFPWDVEARRTLAEGRPLVQGGRKPRPAEQARHRRWNRNFRERWFRMGPDLSVQSACPYFTATSAKVMQYYFARVEQPESRRGRQELR